MLGETFWDILKFASISILIVWIGGFVILKQDAIKELSATQTEQYCTIEDKYTRTAIIGKVSTTRHYIDVYVTDAKEIADTITIPGSLYDELEIGNEIKCVLFYNDKELIKIEVTE